ncbi:excinuclease ABC subunit UvrC [Lactococcus termiticola]|uniref:UvrABC system protein C n=1 Tax=Lactococcus termiticola TaxID=2169526 RepID=A0A2R5HJF3_9LACT|nr:excinuclease ABC subunit UvrC [Lactococcus termiticola]GBG96371.1 excinuclease ABC subunit C [Lactococcus termiticola]
MNPTIKAKLELLPDSPGCYLHKDKNGTIIYVGKAKNLKNRVRSYFRGSHDTKTELLVSEIEDFEYIVVESNIESLLLEINLIQEHKPKFNIMLKDDKSYPFIKITHEKYPRLMITRQVKKDGGLYFGPYPDVGAANEIKHLLDRIFPLRKCSLHEKKVCFYYHIHQCLCPVVNHVDPQLYVDMVEKIKRFLNGNDDEIVREMQANMESASSRLDFEAAAEYRDILKAISTLRTKQRMRNLDNKDRDVFGYHVDNGWMCVQVFFVRQGKLIQRDVNLFPYYAEAEDDFLTFLGQFYKEANHLLPKEIYLSKEIDLASAQAIVGEEAKVIQPSRGEKKQLVAMAEKNARTQLQLKFDLAEKDLVKTQGAVEGIGKLLGIPTPHRIESFDNSNIMGTSPVSAMVVFIDGKPSKKDYRKYKIKTVVGADDYGTMREVIRRRYSRAMREGTVLPDLIAMDGGAGQVHAAQEVLDELGLDIPVAGMQKNDKHQTSELLYGEPLELVSLDRRSQEFFLLTRIQDEVHRFAISFHRQLRGKNSFSSKLDGIEGLGPKRKQKLLTSFKNLKAIEEADVQLVAEAGIPLEVAKRVKESLTKSED